MSTNTPDAAVTNRYTDPAWCRMQRELWLERARRAQSRRDHVYLAITVREAQQWHRAMRQAALSAPAATYAAGAL